MARIKVFDFIDKIDCWIFDKNIILYNVLIYMDFEYFVFLARMAHFVKNVSILRQN